MQFFLVGIVIRSIISLLKYSLESFSLPNFFITLFTNAWCFTQVKNFFSTMIKHSSKKKKKKKKKLVHPPPTFATFLEWMWLRTEPPYIFLRYPYNICFLKNELNSIFFAAETPKNKKSLLLDFTLTKLLRSSDKFHLRVIK